MDNKLPLSKDGWCPSLLSVAVINTMTESILRRKGFSWMTTKEIGDSSRNPEN